MSDEECEVNIPSIQRLEMSLDSSKPLEFNYNQESREDFSQNNENNSIVDGNSNSKINGKDYYGKFMKSYKNSEHLVTHNAQYRNELQKGLDKKDCGETNTPCMFCNDNYLDGSTTIMPQKNKIHSVIHKNLEKKYLTSRDYYNSKVITDIVYNENTNLVSVFKDYLIYDDVSEFLKRYYYSEEFDSRLPKIYEFYEKYSKVFPNYVTIPENKFMFKNIQEANIERKQKFIDDRQRAIEEQNNKVQKQKRNNGHFSDLLENNSDHMFSSKFMDSILKQDEELTEQKKVREANERFIKVIEEISKSDSFMGNNKSDFSANISMSIMNDKENSDLSLIKSEITQDQSVLKEQFANTALSNEDLESNLK